MTEGTQPQEVQEAPQETKEVAEARRQIEQATFEPEAALEKEDHKQAEKVEEAFTAVVDAAVPAAEGKVAEGETGREAPASTEDGGRESAAPAATGNGFEAAVPAADGGRRTGDRGEQSYDMRTDARTGTQTIDDRIENANAAQEVPPESADPPTRLESQEASSPAEAESAEAAELQRGDDPQGEAAPSLGEEKSGVDTTTAGAKAIGETSPAGSGLPVEGETGDIGQTPADTSSGEETGTDQAAASESETISGKAAFTEPASDLTQSYSGVEMEQGAVAQDSDWNEVSSTEHLVGSEPEEAIPAGEEFDTGGSQEFKESLVPYQQDLGQLRELVKIAAGEESASLMIEAAPKTVAEGSPSEGLASADSAQDWRSAAAANADADPRQEVSETGVESGGSDSSNGTADSSPAAAAPISNENPNNRNEKSADHSLQENLAAGSAGQDWRSSAAANGIADPRADIGTGPIDGQTTEGDQTSSSSTPENSPESSELMGLLGNLEATRHRLEMDINSLRDFILHTPEGHVQTLLIHLPTPDGQGGYRLVPLQMPADVNGAQDLLNQQEGWLARILAEIAEAQDQLEAGSGAPPAVPPGDSVQGGAADQGDWQGDAVDDGIEDPRSEPTTNLPGD